MITVEEINAAFLEAGKEMHQALKRTFEARYGSMTDSAVGMLTTVGSGGSIVMSNGETASAVDVAILLEAGLTPDAILQQMRNMPPKPETGTK